MHAKETGPLKSWLLAGGVWLAAALLAGCDPHSSSETPVVTATYAQNGQTVTVPADGILVLRLAGNASAGYAWEFTRLDATRLSFLDSRYELDSDAVGAGGTFTFRFEALQAGATVIGLAYRRSWETGSPAATFSLTVVIQEAETAEVPAFTLESTRWKLAAWSAAALDPAGYDLTAAFSRGRISGRAAVNTYSGSYTAGADGGFAAGALAMTEMAGTPDAMQAESLYLGLLQQARRWRITKAQLVLADASGQDLLIFASAD